MPWPFTPISVPVLTNETELASPSCSTRLAFQLFRQLSSSADSSNLFFSPSSAMLCMALVHELASGETRSRLWSPVNAVYFKALWVDPFHSEFTRDDSFTTATGRTKQLPMMSQSGTYRYCEDAQSQMVAHTRVDTRCTWCYPLREPIGSDFR